MDELLALTSLDQLVEFWEGHDFTDYMAEMEEVSLDSLKPKSGWLQLHLETPYWLFLEQVAKQRGLSPHLLAQLWLAERIKQEAPLDVRFKL